MTPAGRGGATTGGRGGVTGTKKPKLQKACFPQIDASGNPIPYFNGVATVDSCGNPLTNAQIAAIAQAQGVDPNAAVAANQAMQAQAAAGGGGSAPAPACVATTGSDGLPLASWGSDGNPYDSCGNLIQGTPSADSAAPDATVAPAGGTSPGGAGGGLATPEGASSGSTLWLWVFGVVAAGVVYKLLDALPGPKKR